MLSSKLITQGRDTRTRIVRMANYSWCLRPNGWLKWITDPSRGQFNKDQLCLSAELRKGCQVFRLSNRKWFSYDGDYGDQGNNRSYSNGNTKVIVESDSQVAINSILGQSPALKLIKNLIEDITSPVKNLRNIKFYYCNKKANRLSDRMTKRIHICYILRNVNNIS